jgi:hypothetical protein
MRDRCLRAVRQHARRRDRQALPPLPPGHSRIGSTSDCHNFSNQCRFFFGGTGPPVLDAAGKDFRRCSLPGCCTVSSVPGPTPAPPGLRDDVTCRRRLDPATGARALPLETKQRADGPVPFVFCRQQQFTRVRVITGKRRRRRVRFRWRSGSTISSTRRRPRARSAGRCAGSRPTAHFRFAARNGRRRLRPRSDGHCA